MERVKKACAALLESKRFLPQSGISRAMEYAQRLMASLEVYLEDGRIEIDN